MRDRFARSSEDGRPPHWLTARWRALPRLWHLLVLAGLGWIAVVLFVLGVFAVLGA